MYFLPSSGSFDQQSLERALALAGNSAALASPNPTVGCVLGRDGKVLGEGAHLYDLRDHAEIAALTMAASQGHDVRGATAYVTLEPCAHHGRTGPCADALVAAGIIRCVVATSDPNPLVRGRGLAKLRAARVRVDLLPSNTAIAVRARRLNDAFAFAIQQERPFVILKTALSRDGKLAPVPAVRTAGKPFWLTGQAARSDVQRLRHGADALLTGIGTVLADDPALTDRTGLPRRRPLLRIVLDARLRLPLESQVVRTAQDDVLIVCSDVVPAERMQALRSRGAAVLPVGYTKGKLDLDDILKALFERQIRNVLVEAGATLNGALLQVNLVDKLVIYQAPLVLGPEALPLATGVDLPALLQRCTEVHTSVFPHGDGEDILTTGYLHDPWAGVDVPQGTAAGEVVS